MAQQNTVPLADTITYHIEHSAGNFQLRQVMTFDITDNAGNTIVVGGAGVIGTVRQDGGLTAALVAHRVIGLPSEVLWDTLESTQEVFVLAQQDVGGRRLILEGCRVSKIDHTGPNDGNLTMAIEVSIENKPEPIQPIPV